MVLVVSSCENVRDRVVDAFIGLMSLDVLVAVLSSGDGEDGEERENDESWGDGRELGEELEDGDTEEEDVGDSTELREREGKEARGGRRTSVLASSREKEKGSDKGSIEEILSRWRRALSCIHGCKMKSCSTTAYGTREGRGRLRMS